MEKTRPGYIKAAYMFVFLFLLIYSIIILKPLLVPILFAGLLAALFVPVVNLFERWHFPKFFAIIMVILLAIIVLGGLGYLVYLQLSNFVADLPILGIKLSDKLDELQIFINNNTPFNINLEVEGVKHSVLNFAQNNTGSVSQIIFSFLGGITAILLIPVYLFLFLLYRSFLMEFVFRLFGNDPTALVKGMAQKIQKVSQRYVSGMFLVAIILSVVNTIVLFIFGIEHAIFFGIFAGLLNIIPYLGPLMGSLLPIFFSWITKDTLWYPIGIAIYFYTVQLLESYILTPSIVGKTVNINPLVVIIALISGYFIWGVIGMVLIIPTVAILKVIFDETESLKPVGFLLGGIPQPPRKGKLFSRLDKLKEKIIRKN